MLVTNEYGRSVVQSNLYRVSPTGQLYNFQTYAGSFAITSPLGCWQGDLRFHLVVSNVAPSIGSTEGGASLTITGQYFSHSSQYPLEVRVGGQPCSLLSVSATTIQCRAPSVPRSLRSQYQGKSIK